MYRIYINVFRAFHLQATLSVPRMRDFFWKINMFWKNGEPPIILSVGGSLIVPNGGIDVDFLNKLNDFIRKQVKKGRRFFLVAGGGRTARKYRDAGKGVIGDLTDEDLDWLGIHATRLNAHLLRTIFQDIAHPRIIENYDKKLYNWKESVVIGAGWKPGWSTDYDAVVLARDYNSNLILNLSNIDWVYDKDPSKFPDAKPIKKLTWEDMEQFVGTKWEPGINAPFDPVASQLAKKLGLTVIVTNGTDFDNMERILECDTFKGTVIMPYRIDASFYDREYYIGKKGHSRFSPDTWYGRIVRNAVNFYRAFIIKTTLNPKTCLDVGCGTGELIRWLRFFGIEAQGVEVSKDALDIAEPSIQPYVKEADIVKLPYEDNQFDLVVTFDVLEHIERGKIKQAVSETVRVSKKYTLHKIYTKENLWITWFHRNDFSWVSVFTKKHWQKFFSQFDNISLLRGSFFKLPLFFESIFLLRKNK